MDFRMSKLKMLGKEKRKRKNEWDCVCVGDDWEKNNWHMNAWFKVMCVQLFDEIFKNDMFYDELFSMSPSIVILLTLIIKFSSDM